MTIDADKHNFGKQVTREQRVSGTWYRKPRPVHWEHFFFGKSSPLAYLFDEAGENGSSCLGKYFFNLEIELTDRWNGLAKGIEQPKNFMITREHYYSFGALIAYCYIFGIRDLHKNNLVGMTNHFQVVDAEVVLTNLILPKETLLLPYKEIGFEMAGINLLGPSSPVVTVDQSHQILAGYFDLFHFVFKMHEKILSVTTESVDFLAPIRVIIRNTKEYRKILSDGYKPQNLLGEEKQQLERGDIPYFFKVLGKEGLFWLADKDGSVTAVEELKEFKPDVSRHAITPEFLISSQNVIERKMFQGAFSLQKHLRQKENLEFSWGGKKLEMTPGGFKNGLTGRTYIKKVQMA